MRGMVLWWHAEGRRGVAACVSQTHRATRRDTGMSLRRTVAFVAAIMVALILSGCGGERVPDLLGTRLVTSLATIERGGFVLGTVTYDDSAPEPIGTILEQHPKPGRNAGLGSPIDVTVAGPELVRVPRMVGAQYSDALDALRTANLKRGRVEDRYDTRFPEGVVMEQSVQAGTNALQHSRVDLVVSLGPETILVPGVVGRDAVEASSFLRDLGFGVYQQLEHSPRPAGEVLGQVPDAREQVKPGTKVRLRVSRGPLMCTMPDLVGEEIDAARAKLKDLGLAYAVSTTGGAVVIPAGATVAEQEPLPGKVIPVGVTVILRTTAP